MKFFAPLMHYYFLLKSGSTVDIKIFLGQGFGKEIDEVREMFRGLYSIGHRFIATIGLQIYIFPRISNQRKLKIAMSMNELIR